MLLGPRIGLPPPQKPATNQQTYENHKMINNSNQNTLFKDLYILESIPAGLVILGIAIMAPTYLLPKSYI